MIVQGTDISRYVTITKRQKTTDGLTCYISHHPEFPTVRSQGSTPEEAEQNLQEATKLAIIHLNSNKLRIPIPMSFERGWEYIYQIV